ncbi:MAG: LysR family transcriptional regulator [Coriobacteriia bacterium]|nr:LysR family transcriptional regulator [Coriobacteriia bacterium]
MDSAKCTALLKALELGNLSAAADALGYTPSGISRMMASLEQELGFPLLIRSKSGVSPTPDCVRLMPAFTELAAAGRTLEETAAHIRGAEVGTVRMGTAYPQFYGVLAGILADFGGEHPRIRVELSLANSTPLARQLESHAIDLCLISRREGNFDWEPLLQDEHVALVSAQHPLADAPALPITRFAEDDFIEVYPGEESDNSRLLARHGITPNTRFTVIDTQAAHELVAANLGITLMNNLYAKDLEGRIRILPLDPPASVEIGIASAAEAIQPPSVRAFTAFALPRLRDAIGA